MRSILIILKGFTTTILRFPVPVLSALLAFIFLIIEIHFIKTGDNFIHDYRFVKLFLACLLGISLFISFDIYADSQHQSRNTRLGLYLLGFCILGMHYYSITPGMFDSETIFISRYLIFLVCFHLMVSFLAFYKHTEIQAFWQYNFHLFIQIITSLLYSLTLFLGLSSAMWAMDKLFNIQINPDYYTDLGAFIFLIFNTIFFLKGIPKDYAAFKKPIDFKKSIRIFVQYVLLPIVAIYITILYLYMFKIIFTQQLPNGYVCVPILIFSIIGILAYLLIYPIRENKSNQLIYAYSKYFFYILLPLLSLYFIAIMARIMPYGITEDRYLVFMLGVWIVIICIYIISSKIDNIIIIPVSLFVLLAISAIGPWGMFQLSVANQVLRLENLLKRNHLLENGKLIKLNPQYTVPKNDASSIRSIFSFLNKRGELMAIHPWLEENDQLKLDSAIAKNDLVYLNAIFSNLGPVNDLPNELHYYLVAPGNSLYRHPLNISGYQHITQFGCGINDIKNEQSADSLKFDVYLSGNTLVFRNENNKNIQISLEQKFKKLIDLAFKTDTLPDSKSKSSAVLNIINESSQTITLPDDSMQIMENGRKVIFSNLDFTRVDTVFTIYHIEGFLLEE